MKTAENNTVEVSATINAPLEKVWALWTTPQHIVRWNNASEDWHTTKAENDVRPGGRFLSRMEAKDGSAGFDFEGEYQQVEQGKHLHYTLDDGRKVQVLFSRQGDATTLSEIFETDPTHSAEMQQAGWQAILDNFKQYAEKAPEAKKLYFEITIDAPVEKVYNTMLDEKHYQEWTAAFNPGSYFKGSWEKGAKILFLGADEKGEEGGMVSRIRENIPNRYVSIEHLGIVQKGEEITTGPEVEGWAGAQENYTFREEEGKTVVAVEMDSNDEYGDYFADTWPKALVKLREICEA